MLIRRVLARFAGFTIFTKIVYNVMKVVNRGKTGHIDSVKNVIRMEVWVFTAVEFSQIIYLEKA